MLETTRAHDSYFVGLTAPNLDEKCRRVVNRHGRLNRLLNMQAPAIVVRNERRMLRAAVDDLFETSEVEKIVSRIGARAFADSFNRIAGTEIEPPAVGSASARLAA